MKVLILISLSIFIFNISSFITCLFQGKVYKCKCNFNVLVRTRHLYSAHTVKNIILKERRPD